jgi:glutathione S-transferase
MITLYHCVGARSFRALWALEELGLPYALKLTPFPPRFREPGYLDVNPLGTTPTLIDGETLMSESAAIGEYLARRHGPSDLTVAGRARLRGLSELPAHGRGHPHLPADHPPALRGVRARGAPPAPGGGRLRAVVPVAAEGGGQAAGRQRLCRRRRFTMADISVAYALKLGEQLGFADSFPEAFKAHLARMKARDGYQRALAAESAGEPVL